MIQRLSRVSGAVWPVVGVVLLLGSIYIVSVPGYLLYHSLAEIFAIVISSAAFTLTWNTRRFPTNNYLLLVGMALLTASVLNIFHVLSYEGVGVLPSRDANLPTQLWLARRYLESSAFLVAPLFLHRRLRPRVALAAYGGITALLIAAIFGGVFPAAYAAETGLTPFKVASEYLIALIFLAGAYLLYRERDHFELDVRRALVSALVISAAAELLFTLYVGVYDLPNRLGHFLTIVSYYLVYVAVVKTGIIRPYTLLSAANARLTRQEAALRAEVGERQQAQVVLQRQSEWLHSLHDVDRAILQAQSPGDIAAATARSLVIMTGALRASIVLFNSEGGRLEWLATYGLPLDLPPHLPLADYQLWEENRRGAAALVADVAALPESDPLRAPLLAAGIRSYCGVPLTIDEQAIGAIVIGQAAPGALPDDVLEFVRQVAAQLAVAIRQAQLFEEIRLSREQLRTLTHRLVALQEEERRGLSRELHDRAGQSLTALKLRLAMLRREVAGTPAVRSGLEELNEIVDGLMDELHALAVSLRPASLDRMGLVPALEQYLVSYRKQNQVEIDFLANGLDGDRLPADVEITLYRIVQEALTNVARHAVATQASVILTRQDGSVSLVVEDDGCGFDADQALRSGRLGLIGMRERAEMLGGKVIIESAPGRGTTVFISVPVVRN